MNSGQKFPFKILERKTDRQLHEKWAEISFRPKNENHSLLLSRITTEFSEIPSGISFIFEHFKGMGTACNVVVLYFIVNF
uniref:Uncharacterized protein n=1 Tax=Megaselia scalaris TaxID=36166 RepID=T1GVC7_MEGSC